jgi:hypothetical protein
LFSTRSLVDTASDLSHTMSYTSMSFSEQYSSVDIGRLFEPIATMAKPIGRFPASTAAPLRWSTAAPLATR